MKKTFSQAMAKYWILSMISALVLIAFALVMAIMRYYIIAGIEFAMGVALLAQTLVLRHKRKLEIKSYIHDIEADDDGISKNMLLSVPLPMTICSIDGTIRWYNEQFTEIFDEKKLAQAMLDDCIPEIKWSEILKYPEGKEIKTVQNDKTYSVSWRMLKDDSAIDRSGDHYSVFFYLKDITKEKSLENAYNNERIDIAIISIDNYDEFVQKEDDEVVEQAASKLRASLNSWAKISDAVLKKTDRDRYFAVFEHQYLEKYIENNFDIIKNTAKIADEIKFPISISIGIGTGSSVLENETSARQALDLALGRGGGQVCIKEADRFRFYGGKSGEYERSTRVKARAVAAAMADLIKNSDNIIFMGHKNADFDCFGAAVGLQRAARELGRTPYIVCERTAPAIENMYDLLKSSSEYSGMFVDENEVFEEITPNTLLVVLDTHRPSMLPCPKLLERVKKTVIIDHHRRATEFISPCSLLYHEPYASSTCEMVTELLEYMNAGDALTKIEAQCLYTGILLDTKNFMLKTGVRTFEAASYLRKMGLDTVAVRRMFSTSRDAYAMKAEIVRSAEMAGNQIAVAKTYNTNKNMRQIASQAADDMLNLNDVAASVVVYPAEGGTGFCARSIGSLNVQLIMEKLGGGGHMTVSGAYIKGISVDEGVARAKEAVRAYLEEINDKK
ncbi:MAG: DHH family phosphoesterase [Oscillospiraceae bacterium]|nr:DHH family phosphoesterase [Oscillospiraceae bacterium]